MTDVDRTIAAIDEPSAEPPGLLLSAALSRSMKQISGVFRAVATGVHAALAPTTYGDDYCRHRRRCPICNPAGFPKPLAVNGREYRRRTRARSRRNRR